MRRFFCLLMLLVATPAYAADWPGWLGPNRDGSTTEKIKPWKGDLKVVWSKPIGAGHSSPIVVGGKVFIHTQDGSKDAEVLTAFSVTDGKELWKTSYPRAEVANRFGTGPRGTPILADGKIYTHGITGVVACFDANGGKILWQVDTKKEFKAPTLFFGASCSPLIDGDRVIVNVGAKESSIVAFNKADGKVQWKSLDDPPSYASGVAFGKGADRQLVFLTQKGVRGLTPGDGKKLWEFPLVDKLNESSTTPIKIGDLIMASSITYGSVGLKVDPKDNTVKEVWKNSTLKCYFSTPTVVGPKYVYVVTGQLLRPTSALHCVEMETGKIQWTETKVGKYHAALLRTGDNKLLMLSDLGDLVLFDPDPAKYKELARSKLAKKEQIWAHPVLVDGKLYYRDDKELFCLQLPE